MGDLVEATFNSKQRDAAKLEEENDKWLHGDAKCLACGHEWIAVAPLSKMDGLECPSCATMRGSMMNNTEPQEGTVVFQCTCGCELQYIALPRPKGEAGAGKGEAYEANNFGVSPQDFRQICAGCGKITNPFMQVRTG